MLETKQPAATSSQLDDGIQLTSGACKITIFALIIAITADLVDLRRRRRTATSSYPSPPLIPFELTLRGLRIRLQDLRRYYSFIYHVE